MTRMLPVLTVLAGIVVIWYAAAVWMNSTWVFDQAERAGTPVTWGEVIPQTMAQERPLLPPRAPPTAPKERTCAGLPPRPDPGVAAG